MAPDTGLAVVGVTRAALVLVVHRALIVLVAIETGELAERGRIGVARGTVDQFPGVLAGKDGEELAVVVERRGALPAGRGVAGETIGRVAVAAMLLLIATRA